MATGLTQTWRAAQAALACLWAGQLLTVGLLAAPNAFATLERAQAGAYVARLFLLDARLSLVLGVLWLLVEQRRQRVSSEGRLRMGPAYWLPVLVLLLTVGGYDALQPLLAEARGTARFGALHGLSLAAFAAKGLAVLALAWVSASRFFASASRASPSHPG